MLPFLHSLAVLNDLWIFLLPLQHLAGLRFVRMKDTLLCTYCRLKRGPGSRTGGLLSGV